MRASSIRAGAAGAAMLALAGCVGEAPDRAAGVGFGDYEAYLAQREAALRGNGPIPAAVSPPAASASASPLSSAPLGAAPLNPMGAAMQAPPTPAGAPAVPPAAIALVPGATAPAVAGAVAISDEQNFEAVASRETIESDKARLEANRAAYTQVPPTALPERSDNAAPNLAAFALAAPNRLGVPAYNRIGLKFANHDRACGKFASADLAQTAFLQNGGPERDPGNLDPDGDGFACSWDPTPFQSVRVQP
ncbi:MAG: hypothetical protein Q8J98_07710 [Phaeovulum sp.]|uniref:hypothetical protein n=1 Tax=Phaeovulum sp. TaxID=2934796 RepID=UPI00273042F5|nr:hypothetical protein [Phaeovulum sp.]MDP2062978.1 hypothetical protein [Phaeovulum sp.]